MKTTSAHRPCRDPIYPTSHTRNKVRVELHPLRAVDDRELQRRGVHAGLSRAGTDLGQIIGGGAVTFDGVGGPGLLLVPC